MTNSHEISKKTKNIIEHKNTNKTKSPITEARILSESRSDEGTFEFSVEIHGKQKAIDLLQKKFGKIYGQENIINIDIGKLQPGTRIYELATELRDEYLESRNHNVDILNIINDIHGIIKSSRSEKNK